MVKENVKRKPAKERADVIPRRIWIGGLPTGIDEKRLEHFFSYAGPIQEVHIRHGKVDTFAFVTMGDDDGYEKALEVLDRAKIDGKEIRVNVVLKDKSRQGGPAGDLGKGGGKGGKGDRRSATPPRRNSSHKEEPPVQKCKVWVGGLPDEITEQELKDVFSKCGPVTEVLIRSVRNSGDTIAFIRFSSSRDAERAQQRFDKSDEFGPVVTCELARSRSQAPARNREPSRTRDERSPKPESRSRTRMPTPNQRVDRRRSRSRSMIMRPGVGRREDNDDQSDDKFRVSIENLPDDMEENELWTLASEYGEVVTMDMWREGKSKAAFVDYLSKRAQRESIEAFEGRRIEGWSMRVTAFPAK